MTSIYVIRHAQAEGNLYRISQGQSNSGITDRGWQQIEALRRRFENTRIDAVYSSDLYRTCATAGAIYLPRRLPLHKRKDLREIYVGDWEGMTWGDIARKYPENMKNFSQHLDKWHVDGAETPEQVRDRVVSAVREIAAENEGKTVAVFSHGCAIRILLGTLQGLPISRLGEVPCGDNTAVSLIEADGGSLKVIFRDDNSHLKRGIETDSVCRDAGALQPGLYFEPIRLPEQRDWLAERVAEIGGVCPYKLENAVKKAGERRTLVALWDERPVGVIQMDETRDAEAGQGWISLYFLVPGFRGRGCGVQLLGQAVQVYRAQGRSELCIALDENNTRAETFFSRYGFRAARKRGEAGTIWTKGIWIPEL